MDISKFSEEDLTKLKQNFSKENNFECPNCKEKKNIVKNGRRNNGNQRYFCNSCNKSFSFSMSPEILKTRIDLDVWVKFIDCMQKNMSIRKTASQCGIHRNTVLKWKKKITELINNDL